MFLNVLNIRLKECSIFIFGLFSLNSDSLDFQPKWNSIDGKIDRTSFHGKYEIVEKFPLNVAGRTGVIGRGLLGRWGVNHAADPIVTRWKRNIDGTIMKHGTTEK